MRSPKAASTVCALSWVCNRCRSYAMRTARTARKPCSRVCPRNCCCAPMIRRPPSMRAGTWAMRKCCANRSRRAEIAPVTYHNQVERLVLASQIQGLPNRVGFLRLAGQDSVRCVHIPLIQRAARMEAFVPRQAAAERASITRSAECTPCGPRCRCDPRSCASNGKREMKEWLIALVLLVAEPRGTGVGF